MHELAICQSLFEQAGRIALDNNAGGIETIIVSLGPLSGVEAPLLMQAFTIARVAAGFPDTELEIEIVPIVIQCQECGAKSEAKVNKLICASCGTWRVNVVSGEDMLLKSLVLIDEPASVKAR